MTSTQLSPSTFRASGPIPFMANQDFFLYIPYVNRIDLLEAAVSSVKGTFKRVIIIDNSPDGLPLTEFLRCDVIRPTVSLTFAQTQNMMRQYAIRQRVQWFAFMHNDARSIEKTAQKLIEAVKGQENAEWGAIFTNYDTFCAYNTSACYRVGEWDTNLPQYYSDDDYYRRLRLANYRIVETKLPVEHNGASNTMKSDEVRHFLNGQTFGLYGDYYKRKWGGPPHQEVFTVPFNRPDLFK